MTGHGPGDPPAADPGGPLSADPGSGCPGPDAGDHLAAGRPGHRPGGRPTARPGRDPFPSAGPGAGGLGVARRRDEESLTGWLGGEGSRFSRLVLRISRWLDLLPRPLNPVRSIKLKIGLLLCGAGLAGLAVFIVLLRQFPLYPGTTAMLVALITSQILAHGMTSPLREMTAAARAMARGDYSRRVQSTSRDEVGELAAAFNTMAAELATADRRRRELIANVSHELRTPITALRGLLENIVDGVATAEPQTLVTALAQTERLSRLVAELLDLSRLDAGVVPLNLVEVDVAAFLGDAVREAEVTATGSGRDVTFDLATPGMPVLLRADPGRLHQVLANLLDNAARYSPPGGTVSVCAQAQPNGVVIDVTDQGTGIPADRRAAVFERFTRGERAGGREGRQDGGTGLGLAIARWIVELHRGSIEVMDPPHRPAPPGKPEHGPGCRIRVTLPHPAPAMPPARGN